jgi:hypothetical protein
MDKMESTPENYKKSLKMDANTSPIEFENNGGMSPLKIGRHET